MYFFVAVQDRRSYYAQGPAGRNKARLEQSSGERCLIVPYQELDLRLVENLRPRAIVMSGFGGPFQTMKVGWFRGIDEVLHQARLPILCICGSHQLLGFSFNRDLRRVKRLVDEPMRRIRPTEDFPRRAQGDSKHDLSPYFLTDGFFPITRIKPDPLFKGLPRRMMLRCAHYCEVKKLPPGFELLASSGHCRIAAMRHRDRPLYGTQFHPEAYERPFFHGRTVLENFARIVRDFWDGKDKPEG